MQRRQIVLGILIGLILVLSFHWSLVINIAKPLSLTHGDMFQFYYALKHYNTHWNSFFTLPMFSGEPYSLLFSEFFLLHGLVSIPLYALTHNIVLVAHIFILLTVLASFLSMYVFCLHVTKRILPSVLGAVIYVFNPFVMGRFPDHVMLISLAWIPLIFLYVEKILEQSTRKRWATLFVLFILQLISSALYYSVFLTVIVPLYIGIRIWQTRKRIKIYWEGSIPFLATVASYIYLYTRNPIWINTERKFAETIVLYSAWFSDWFFAPPQNVLYGGLKVLVAQTWPYFVRIGIYSEHNLFWGISVFIIFLLSFFSVRLSKYRLLWYCFLFVGILSFLGSLGWFTFLYKFNPLFQYIRVPARFAVFVFFALGVIASMTTAQIRRHAATILFIVLVLLEYWNKPLAFYTVSSEEQSFYQTLENQKHIKQILDFPINNRIPPNFSQARNEVLDARYLLPAATLHDKMLFNGYNGFIPDSYFEKTAIISIRFPSPETLIQLKRWGVDGIILHRTELKDPNTFEPLKQQLLQNGASLIAATPDLALFDLTRFQEAR